MFFKQFLEWLTQNDDLILITELSSVTINNWQPNKIRYLGD